MFGDTNYPTTFVMKVNLENAAFEGGMHELRRILEKTAEEVSEGYDDGSIHDVNGNKVGRWSLE